MFESETHLNYWRIKEGKHLLTKKSIRKICEFFHITKRNFNARLKEFIRNDGNMLLSLSLFSSGQAFEIEEELLLLSQFHGFIF